MRWMRRGFRRGTYLKPRETKKETSREVSEYKKTLPKNWEEFYESILPMIRPNYQGTMTGLSGIYQKFSKTEQKNLTDKLAGQILFAHSDVVSDILKRLSKLSLDLSQQTEVAYRRLRLVDRFF